MPCLFVPCNFDIYDFTDASLTNRIITHDEPLQNNQKFLVRETRSMARKPLSSCGHGQTLRGRRLGHRVHMLHLTEIRSTVSHLGMTHLLFLDFF
jgi:hypothetical protein